MAAKKKLQKKAPQTKAKPQEKKPAAKALPAKPKAQKVVDDDVPDKPEGEKKVYSREEQEILRRKRFTLDDDEEVSDVKVKKKKGAFPEDEELADSPRSYDSDEYFYEETSEDKYA
jgi:hypothetical protein